MRSSMSHHHTKSPGEQATTHAVFVDTASQVINVAGYFVRRKPFVLLLRGSDTEACCGRLETRGRTIGAREEITVNMSRLELPFTKRQLKTSSSEFKPHLRLELAVLPIFRSNSSDHSEVRV